MTEPLQPTEGAPPPAAPRLAAVEIWDADSRLVRVFDVQAWPLKLGTALDNPLLLWEAGAGGHVATLAPAPQGGIALTVGPHAHALRLPRQAHAPPAGATVNLAPLARWQVGTQTLCVRLVGEPLPAPAHRPTPPPVSRPALAALGLAGLAWATGSTWLRATPDADWQEYLTPILGVAGGLLVWSLAFALLSKLFNHRFVWLPHLRLALAFGLGLAALDAGLGLLAFALDWPLASRLRHAVWVLGLAALLAQHLKLALPAQGRRVVATFATLAVVGLALETAVQWQRDGRLFSELYATHLGPPSWRLVPAQPVKALLADVQTLEAPLRQAAEKAALKETGL